MRKKMKSVIACITCLAMAASLAGCSGSTGTSDAGSSAAPVPTVATQGAEGDSGQASTVDIDRAKEFVTIATGPTSGIYYPIGGAFATVLGNAGYKTSAQATGASVENINLISAGEAELAIAMQDSVMQAYEGFGAFDTPNSDLRAVMRLWPNYVQLVTTEGTGIKSVEDLKGKRVGVGAPNSGVELNARMIYEAYGMTYEDSDVDYLSYGEAIDQMKNGQCDAAFVTSGLPNSTVSELAFSYDMVIVPIDGAGRDHLVEKYPFFAASIIPADTYNNEEDVESVFVYNIMIVNKDLSDDMVYDMMNCIFDDIGSIKASHNTADKNIDISFGVDDVKIPLHDGAAKWWQDHGYETPQN
ncbi:TAXI family TRAP transporter solute-binding subunit [uncultured Clostridium sp.]|uniref:TAXI family TRAP transporter solute-binding subunit n=1 Tax=uncultured Clostridium sp. TaxID=59620 RepID=UPI0025E82427|nr:TAXI family TRAP transporter solute-binding subunit [uncultured Clostridium sp.]